MATGYQSSFRSLGGYHVFTAEHVPEEPKGSVLVIAPFLEERLFCRPVLRNLSRSLMDEGWHVLRFDPPGEGDSDGDLMEVGVEESLDQIQRLATWLRNRAPGPLVLLGMRWGASLALRLSDRIRADAVVAVEPLVRGEAYLQRLLRQNLTTQMATWGKIATDRKALLELSAGGEPVNVQGFDLGPRVIQGIRSLDVRQARVPRTALIHCDTSDTGAPADWRGLMEREHVAYHRIPTRPFWFEPAVHDPIQSRLRDTVNECLTEWFDGLE